MILTGIPNKWVFINLLLLVLYMPVNSQVFLDFEDSLLTGWTQNEDLRWEISGNSPLFGKYSLHHAYDNQSGGSDRISYSVHDLKPDSGIVTWNFFVKHEYSSKQDRKLWIDNISVTGSFFTDSISPVIDSVFVLSSKTLYVKFNEPVITDPECDTGKYFVNKGIGHPVNINEVSEKEVIIGFSSHFTEEKEYNINVTGISDISGNIIEDSSTSFVWYVPKAFDIVINEIMADPVPAVELPPVEYVELYNTSDYPIYLNNWIFACGGNEKILSDATIDPDSYLILCAENDVEDMTSLGNVMGISAFPALSNSGKTLTLKNNENRIISCITYNDKWYKDDYKSEGGWSLEQIDPSNPCGGITNWKASVDYMGGTPGSLNSVLDENPDYTPPAIKRAVIKDDNCLLVLLTEPCDSVSAQKTSNYFVDHGFGNPDSVQPVAPQYSEVFLHFGKSFMPGYIYILELNNGLYDCAGNASDNTSVIEFGVPEEPDSLDIIINEILFNPLLDGVDFVEIYNRSEKIIDLEIIKLATRDKITNKIESVSPVSEEPALLFPSEYIAVTTDITKLQEQYYFDDPGAVFQVFEMPAFNNDEDKVILTDKRLQIFDEFEYNEDMHFPLLSSVEGVSLERINFDNPTNRESNWHSAAENAGFGTPGYLNSQYSENNGSEAQVWVSPEVFSPDNDGVDDLVHINFNFKDPGNVASVYVFDAKGRVVRHLIRNELISVEGSVSWDGLDDMNKKASIGIYLIYIEIFDMKGNMHKYKETCVLAGKLQR